MKIISFINNRDVIRRVLEHLKQLEEPEERTPPPTKGCSLELGSGNNVHAGCHYEPFDDGWPVYEEPEID